MTLDQCLSVVFIHDSYEDCFSTLGLWANRPMPYVCFYVDWLTALHIKNLVVLLALEHHVLRKFVIELVRQYLKQIRMLFSEVALQTPLLHVSATWRCGRS